MPENPGPTRASTSSKLSRSTSTGFQLVDERPLKSPSNRMRNGVSGSSTVADGRAPGSTSRCTSPKSDLIVMLANHYPLLRRQPERSSRSGAAGVNPWTGLLARQNLRLRREQLLPPRLHRRGVRHLPRQFQKHPVVPEFRGEERFVEGRQFRIGAGGGEQSEPFAGAHLDQGRYQQPVQNLRRVALPHQQPQ